MNTVPALGASIGSRISPASRRTRGRGFTLVEVLIAVGIFALIGIVSAALLGRIIEARALTEARADRLSTVQTAMQRLERDILQWQSRAIRDRFGDAQPALQLRSDGELEFTTGGWSNPLDLPRSELQRVVWTLGNSGGLVRRFWSVLDRAQDSEPREQQVLGSVEGFSITLIDVDGGSWRNWPPEGVSRAATVLPGETPEESTGEAPALAAVRLSLTVAPFGVLERLIPLPELLSSGAGDTGTPAGEEGASEAGDADPDEGDARPNDDVTPVPDAPLDDPGEGNFSDDS